MSPSDVITAPTFTRVEDISRRGLLVMPLAAAIFAACRSNGEGQSAVPTGDQNDGFPRTVQHNLGETMIPTRPQRVVTFSDGNELATLLALGVKPVGFGQRNDPPHPWTVAAGALDPAIERVPYGTTGPDLERIAAWKPDLILGQHTLVERSFTLLSGIAPTVATDIFDWRLVLRQVGQSMGLEQRAEAKRAELEGMIAATRSRLARHADKRAVYIALPDASIFVYNERQTFGRVAAELGLPVVPTTGSGTSNELSPEQAREITADLLLLGGWNYKGPYGFDALRDLIAKGLVRNDAVRNGRVVELTESDANALVFANPLTLPVILSIFEREYTRAFSG